jgi:wyosine [tRNA(Phe)-imidazoG37] synthetase (radical SAM superfamily)
MKVKKRISPAQFKYIYGPVHSWRLGISLGIDPISRKEKRCDLDCVYCQLGPTDILSRQRRVYVPTEKILIEIASLPDMKIDYLTFSGRGEPTLAKNLGDMIRSLRKTRRGKIAVITNSVLMDRKDVRDDLALADFVLAKLDACDQKTLACVNRPAQGVYFGRIVEGIKKFRKQFKGRLGLQIMFIEANKDMAGKMAALARDISPDEIEINTPLRPSRVKPLSPAELGEIKEFFKGLPAKTVYELERKAIDPLDEQATVERHGRYREGLEEEI